MTDDVKNHLAHQFPGYDLVVSHCWFHISSIGKYPYRRVYFYDKRNPNQLVKKKWNDVELFHSAEDADPKPYCKIYIFSRKLNLSNDDANLIKSDFPRILQNMLQSTGNTWDTNSNIENYNIQIKEKHGVPISFLDIYVNQG
ncbi:hypothetical protein J437_LFUL019115 [Ladona fulva]|uniref:Uncharacterized protein n=1 Tax=Ladona fulva TaxID=123851 RepID=A0A8K0KS27_LADFU|nr:hypothetical protein J437_LFUL019115 [Ladona fulva]